MIGRKTTLALANMVLGVVLGLVAAKLIAVYFGNANYGEVSYTLGILGLLFFVTDLGMGQAHVKRVSEGRDPGDCFATFAVFKAVSTLAFVLVAVAGLYVYLGVLGKPLEDTTLPVVAAILVYYVAKSLQEIGQSSFDARLETARSQLTLFADTVVRVGLTAVGAVVIAALVHGSGPLAGRLDRANPVLAWMAQNPSAVLAIAIAAGGAVAAGLALTMLARALERGRFRWDLLKDYATFAFPLFLSSAVGVISANIDQSTLGLFLGKVDAGLFGQVKRLPLVIAGIGSAVSVLLFPAISRMVAEGDRQGIARSTDKAIRYLSMLVVPIVAFTIAFAVPLLRIVLSDETVPGADAMRLLLVWVVLLTLAIPHSTLLLGMDRSDVVAKIGIATALTLIVLNLTLVPNDLQSLGIPLAGLGVLGAALGTLVSGAVWYGGLRIASRRIAGYREHADIWRHVLAAGAMALALRGLDLWLPLVHWYDVLLYTAVGGVLYLAALVAVRAFTRDDLDFLRESLNPFGLGRYMRDELRTKRR